MGAGGEADDIGSIGSSTGQLGEGSGSVAGSAGSGGTDSPAGAPAGSPAGSPAGAPAGSPAGSPVGGGATTTVPGGPLGGAPATIARETALGSDWHPDADGDGVPTASDRCPGIWDPSNAAAACDPRVDYPVAGAPINDLRAEHVTPYGAWFTFRSNESNEWGYYAEVAWSETRSEIETPAGFTAAVDRGATARVRVNERLGDRIPTPILVTNMKPGTTYYAATRDNGGRLGKVLTFTTKPAPAMSRPSTFPRVYATSGLLTQLRQRNQSGDAGWTKWKNLLAPKLDRALSGSDIEDEKYCNAAALLYHGTGDASILAKAKTFHGKLLSRWEANSFSGNGYRWADSALAICTDLLWNDLDAATRERAVSATLPPDEHAAFATSGSDFRVDDTDEAASSVRSWLIDGLLGCNAPGISQAVSDRACKVLDAGMRYWHGMMLVQARRDRGFFAMSGGHMPDSTRYAQGSSQYWVESFWTMANQGVSPAEYAPWVMNNLLATYLHPTTPRMKGFATYGDVDKYQTAADPEPNSCTIDTFHFDVLALQMGVLQAAGRTAEAGWARTYLNTLGPSDNYQSRYHMLMFDTAAITPIDYKVAAPPAYLDSGFGILYDRTSWSPSASMMTFRGGWSGIDHSQEEQGHFQLYRGGRWLTHESIAYEGEAGQAQGHNVMQLGVLYNHGVQRNGQYAFRNNGPVTMLRRSSNTQHAYAHGDYTGAYQSGFTAYYAFDKVERAIVWLKGNEQGSPDTMVVYDHVVNSPTAPAGVQRNFQIHLDGNPSITGRTASLELDASPKRQKVAVNVVLPASTTLSVVAPLGAPGNSTDAIYTHRLVANPNSSAADLRLVTVVQGSDVGGTPAAAPVGVDVAGFVGTRVGTSVVLFPKAPLDPVAGLAPSSVTFDATGVSRFYVAGFVPGQTYAVSVTGAVTSLAVAAVPGAGVKADRGGMLVFDVSASKAVTAAY